MTCIMSRFVPAISPLLVTAMCTTAICAGQARADAKPAGTPASAKLDARQLPDTRSEAEVGLPPFLLQVPAGDVWLGLTPEQLVEMAVQSVNPDDPASAAKETKKVERNLRQTASALGHTKEPVDAFYLGKWPITNKEYEVFVKQTGHRFPFHWWRYGCKDDYAKRIEDIQRQFPKEGVFAAVYYWKAHWQDQKLPYALKDDNGKPIDDKPVTFINYRDATAFAGWLGMRLPTETELTRAIKGDADIVWPWGNKKDGPGDKLTEKVLEQVKLKDWKDQHLKNIGEVQFATGPFGHLDMTGQVWCFTSDIGFEPLCAKKDYDAALKDLKKLKLGKLLETVEAYKPGEVVIKGGSFASGGDPIQLSADSRYSMQTEDVVETVGLRLAKTLRPGYDMLYSLARSGYKQDMWVPGQELSMADQIGMERYEFGAGQFPQAYHALSFAPVNYLTNARNVTLKSVAEQSQVHPVPIGTLAISLPLLTPKLDAGIYTVYYRNKGVPRDLTDALKIGFKEVQAALKKKGAAEEPKEEAGKDDKKDDWRSVLKRFGITEKDLEPKDAEKIKFIRIGDFQVDTEVNQLLFYGNDGLVKAALPLRFDQLTAGGLQASTLEVGEAKLKDDKLKEVSKLQVKLHFGVQLEERVKTRLVEFLATMVLDAPPITAEAPWRLPAPAK